MATKLLKAKPKTATTHNKAMAEVLDKVQTEDEVPFQVRIPLSLAESVGKYKAATRLSNKAIVIEALTNYLAAKQK